MHHSGKIGGMQNTTSHPIPLAARTYPADPTGRSDWSVKSEFRKPLRYPLSQEAIAGFQRDGFVVLPGLLDDMADQLAAQADHLLTLEEYFVPGNMRTAFWERDGQRGLNKIDPFFDLAPFWGRLVRDRRICDALASLYEGREPRLFKDKLIYKPPMTGPHGVHQDYTWWQGFPTSLLSVAIPIDGSNAHNGATYFYPGMHKQGLLHKGGILGGTPSEKLEGRAFVQPETNPGDVLIFDCMTPHGATANQSDGFRRIIFLSYNDSAHGEHYQAHLNHFFDYRVKGAEGDSWQEKFFL